MNPLDAAREHYLARFADLEGRWAGESGWLASLRRESLDRFAELGFPSRKLEDWRHTNVAPIARVPFETPATAGAISRKQLEWVSAPVFACSLFVFVDGRFAPELSAPPSLSGDVRVESLAQLRAEAPERLEPLLASCAEHKRHPFAALNTAFLDDGAVLVLPEGLRDERPIHVVFAATAGERPAVVHPRVLIAAGAGSRMVVIQDHVRLGDAPGFTNAVTEVRVAEGAALDLVLLQREPATGFHVSNLSAHVERHGRFSAHTLTFDGALVRNDVNALLADEGAECALNGLFIADREQLVDNHTLVDHAMPHGTSRELYKGVLGGAARGVFHGRVIVRPDAQRSDAVQSNPNLLLSDSAQVNTKPQLEIHADDVKCSHGSSIGQLDEDALFYLRARGIGEAAARELLTRGFAMEILDALPVRALAEGMDELLRTRLLSARGGA